MHMHHGCSRFVCLVSFLSKFNGRIRYSGVVVFECRRASECRSDDHFSLQFTHGFHNSSLILLKWGIPFQHLTVYNICVVHDASRQLPVCKRLFVKVVTTTGVKCFIRHPSVMFSVTTTLSFQLDYLRIVLLYITIMFMSPRIR